MPKRYNTPHRSRVVKTRLSEDEYADFTARLAPYGISQSEFLRQAIRRTTIRPVIHVSAVNDELLSNSVEELYGISKPSMDLYNEAMTMKESNSTEEKIKRKQLKTASKALDRFHKKAFKYIQAEKLMKQYECYSSWDSIFSR